MRELVRQAVKNPAFRDMALGFSDDNAIDRWIRQHVYYVVKPFQILVTPLRMLEDIETHGFTTGNCADSAMLVAAIFKVRGKDVQFEAIQTAQDRQGFSHVYTRVFDAYGNRIYDATVMPGTKYKFIRFMVQPL